VPSAVQIERIGGRLKWPQQLNIYALDASNHLSPERLTGHVVGLASARSPARPAVKSGALASTLHIRNAKNVDLMVTRVASSPTLTNSAMKTTIAVRANHDLPLLPSRLAAVCANHRGGALLGASSAQDQVRRNLAGVNRLSNEGDFGMSEVIRAAAKKWFYESFDCDLLEKMQKAGLIAQAEGFSISVMAELELEMESAFLSQLAALREELADITDQCIDHVNLYKAWTKERDDLQQRLADAERRNAELEARSNLTNDELIEIARNAALNSVHRYNYMPCLPEDAYKWSPHYWVIEAMRAALNPNPEAASHDE
jgi:hypothetical protein